MRIFRPLLFTLSIVPFWDYNKGISVSIIIFMLFIVIWEMFNNVDFCLRQERFSGGREWESNPPENAGVLNRI